MEKFRWFRVLLPIAEIKFSNAVMMSFYNSLGIEQRNRFQTESAVGRRGNEEKGLKKEPRQYAMALKYPTHDNYYIGIN